MKYPIIIPTNYLTGRQWDGYEYEFTELDNLICGWKNAFGEQWAAEVQDVINKMSEPERSDIRIIDLKEKYGMLRQYFNHHTDDLDEVIKKYERISKRTCILCGDPATCISLGWISPYCDKCVAGKNHLKFVSMDSWYNERECEISD